MEVYLVQHGEAKPEDEDPQRPLTDQGRADVAAVAVALARHGIRPAEIWHSGKLRASQTAAAFAEALEPDHEIREKAGLAPRDDPDGIAEEIGAARAPVMLVGHLPHLSRLAGLLVTGDSDMEMVGFRQGGVLCLSRLEEGWRIAWYLTPELSEVVTA